MAGPLTGRHALVTGAGRGIGAEIARTLSAAGADVTLLGRSAEPLQANAAKCGGGRTSCITADVSNSAAVAEAVARAREALGPVTILVNNAGHAGTAALHKTADALWSSLLATNLTGTFNCIRECLPDMLAAGFGRIVNIGSTAGLIGYRYASAYCAAKHGVVGLTRAVALEVATRNITVNAVCPGYTETDLLARAVQTICAATQRTPEQARAELLAASPRGRFVTPAEVASTVLWLCSPGAESITGQAIAVDGGEISG